MRQWAAWLQTTLGQVVHGDPDPAGRARWFLLRWSMYSSLVIRDLTLRSAPSFGSFHLMRLLYDEYLLYLVEQIDTQVTTQPSLSLSFEHSALILCCLSGVARHSGCSAVVRK